MRRLSRRRGRRLRDRTTGVVAAAAVGLDAGVYPSSHYGSYNCATGDEHVSGYILGRVYSRLSNSATGIGDVHRAFEDATDNIFRPDLRDEVHQAFIDAGVTTSKRRTDTCPGANP